MSYLTWPFDHEVFSSLSQQSIGSFWSWLQAMAKKTLVFTNPQVTPQVIFCGQWLTETECDYKMPSRTGTFLASLQALVEMGTGIISSQGDGRLIWTSTFKISLCSDMVFWTMSRSLTLLQPFFAPFWLGLRKRRRGALVLNKPKEIPGFWYQCARMDHYSQMAFWTKNGSWTLPHPFLDSFLAWLGFWCYLKLIFSSAPYLASSLT